MVSSMSANRVPRSQRKTSAVEALAAIQDVGRGRHLVSADVAVHVGHDKCGSIRPGPRELFASVPSLSLLETSSESSSLALIYQILNELPNFERAEVLRSLQVARADDIHPKERIRPALRWIVRLLALCCIGLVPWTIGLALTLPRSYLVGNWPLAWTGFDVILLGCLATTAWALWKQRQVAVPASMITSVLLLCDAWFDILTAHGGHCLAVSIASAAFAELPIAMLLGLISLRLLHNSGGAASGAEPTATTRSLWSSPLIGPIENVEQSGWSVDERKQPTTQTRRGRAGTGLTSILGASS
jgi:hypothetical protein